MAVCSLLICPANDPTGTPIETWTDSDILDLRLEISLNDLGKNQVRIPRHTWEGSALDATQSYYVRVNVPYIDNDDPFWGFWLLAGDFILVDEDERGGENVTIGGPGPAWILTKAVLNHEEWTDHAGTYVQEGNWYWANKNYGQILNDLINEDAASDYPALDNMETPGWSNTNDVDGTPWTEFDGIFSQPVGTNYLNVIRELQKGDELDVWVSPKLNLRAYVSYGRDLTGSAFGAGVVRFVGSAVSPDEPHNIVGELTRHKDGGKSFTHVLVLGKERREDGNIIEGSSIHRWSVDPDWSSGDEIHQGFMEYETSNPVILERAGRRLIRRSKDRSGRMVTCEVLPGQDESLGLYLPGAPGTDKGDYWIGDLVTFKTGAGDDFDLNNRDLPIAKIKMQLDTAARDDTNLAKGLSWRVFIETGDDIIPSSTAASSKNTGTGHGPRLLLCEGTSCSALAPSMLDDETDTNGDAENAAGTEWSGGSGYNTTYKHGGARSYARLSATSCDLVYDFGSQLFSAGTRYVLDIWRRQTVDHDSTTITFGDPVGDQDFRTYAGVAGSDPPDLWEEENTGADGLTWQRGRVCWTPSADRTNVRMRFQATAFGTSDFAVDDLALYSTNETVDDLIGSSNRAARCDHGHNLEDLGDVDLTGLADEDVLTWDSTASKWVPGAGGGGGGAPTTADYLVGTAQAGLSAEIVVGTSPGGELGGTWASPTVDATHSGSAHHAQSHGHTGADGSGTVDHANLTNVTANQHHNESHQSRHNTGGADALKLDDLASPDDNTDLNASTSAHGLLRKLDNNTTHYLRGDGAWADPAVTPGGGIWAVVVKANDEAVQNNTIQDDNELFLAIGANEWWEFEVNVWFDSITVTADFKHDMNGPAGATVWWSTTGLDAAGTVQNDAAVRLIGSAAATQDTSAGSGTIRHARIKGIIKNGGTAGNLTFRWAQNITNATNTTVHAGSVLKALRLV